MSNSTNMKYQTIKIRVPTLKKLRMLHAITGKTMMDLVDDLVQKQLDKEKIKDG